MRNMHTLYDMALRFAQKHHAGQIDRAGEPYYKHLARVSMRCDTPLAKVVAILHDVLEDTDAQPEWIRERFGDEIINSVLCLTKQDDEPYMDYIKRVACDPVAREVKIADLIDNSNLSRLPKIELSDVHRQRKYNNALTYLLSFNP